MNRPQDAWERGEEKVGDGPDAVEQDQTEKEPMLYCPVCSSRLTSLKCKLLCARCGYYMSCADYY